MPIIRYRHPFDDSFIPPSIADRVFEQQQLRRHFEPILNGDVQPVGLHIIGSAGTGKTVTMNVVLKNLPLKPCYLRVDEWVKAKTYRMVCDLLSFFGLGGYGNAESSLYDIKGVAGDKPFIVVIDEADNMSPSDINPIIHFLSRETYATIVVISRRPDFLSGLREDTRDSFKYRELLFKPYNAHELFEILKQRAELGLYKNTYDDEVLWAVAKEAEPFGSARYAINLLLQLAEVSERMKKKRVAVELIEQAHEEVEKAGFRDLLRSLPAYHAILLSAIYTLVEKRREGVTLDKVEKEFVRRCRLRGLKVLSRRTLYDKISDLKARGLIDVVKHGKGRGRGFEAFIVMEDYTIEAIKSIYEESMGQKRTAWRR